MSDTVWNNAINQMVEAINSDNNIKDFFVNFEPSSDRGYAWTQDSQYKYYARILDYKTNSTGHSGASFACCLREAVDIIRRGVVVAEEVLVVEGESGDTDNNDSNITTLEPIA